MRKKISILSFFLSLSFLFTINCFAFPSDNDSFPRLMRPRWHDLASVDLTDTKKLENYLKYDIYQASGDLIKKAKKLKELDPNFTLLRYLPTMHNIPLRETYPGHWLLFPYTKLSKDVPNCTGPGPNCIQEIGPRREKLFRTKIYVENINKLKQEYCGQICAGERGRDYFLMFLDDSIQNPHVDYSQIEHAQIDFSSVNPTEKSVEIIRGLRLDGLLAYKSHKKGTPVALHISSPAAGSRNWMFNLSENCPKDKNGKNFYQVYSQWIGKNLNKTLKDKIYQGEVFDGIVFDVVSPQRWPKSDLNINGKLDSEDNDDNWSTGVLKLYRLTRQGVGNQKIIVWDFHDPRGLNYKNGSQFESLGAYDRSPEELNADVLTDHINLYFNLDSFSNYYSPKINEVRTRLHAKIYNPDKINHNKHFRLIFGIALLGDGYFSYASKNQQSQDPNIHYNQWFDEFALDPLTAEVIPFDSPLDQIKPYTKYLGKAASARRQIKTNIWRRDFDNGIVLVNIGSTAQTVTLEKTYRKIKGIQDPAVNNGKRVQTLQLPAYDGIILLKPRSEIIPITPTPPQTINLSVGNNLINFSQSTSTANFPIQSCFYPQKRSRLYWYQYNAQTIPAGTYFIKCTQSTVWNLN